MRLIEFRSRLIYNYRSVNIIVIIVRLQEALYAMKKVNCWEFKRCERTPGGKKEEELGICPVTMEKRLDDVPPTTVST